MSDPSLPPEAIAEPNIPTAPPPVTPKKRRRWGVIITITLLSLALIATAVFLVIYLLRLQDALAHIKEQDRELDEQRELLDKKETFGAAMEGLMGTASKFEGVLIPTTISFDELETLAVRGWVHRWDASHMDEVIDAVADTAAELETTLADAAASAGSNGTGSTYEAVIDQLGGGHALSVIDDADTLCQSDVLACVTSQDPRVVHFDAADDSLPYMTDAIRTGIAYHEFAHVLQFANPEPTAAALESFSGDVETMADCYALTYLDGWKLDHRVWVSSYSWWDVSIGYGYTCNDQQKQVIMDWYGKLGVSYRAVSQ